MASCAVAVALCLVLLACYNMMTDSVLTVMVWSAGAPWSTQAVVEWMTSVQLELLRSGRSKRMTEQLSSKAIDKVSHDDQQQDGVGSAAGDGCVPSAVGQS